MPVTCVPMPPCFFGLPLRQMRLPFLGPLPVNSQNLAINSNSKSRSEETSKLAGRCKHFPRTFVAAINPRLPLNLSRGQSLFGNHLPDSWLGRRYFFENTRLASSKASLDPMSYHRPGTLQ